MDTQMEFDDEPQQEFFDIEHFNKKLMNIKCRDTCRTCAQQMQDDEQAHENFERIQRRRACFAEIEASQQ